MTKLAIPTREGRVDDHFGHCDHYSVFTIDDNKQVVSTERLDSPQGCGCKSNIASVMQQMGITMMLAGNMGMGAFNKLSAHGISVMPSRMFSMLYSMRLSMNMAPADTATKVISMGSSLLHTMYLCFCKTMMNEVVIARMPDRVVACP